MPFLRPPQASPDHPEAGFAQILVLSALAVLAAILTVAISTARLGGQQISALDARVLADARLASGLALLQEALADPANDLDTRALRAPITAGVAGASVELSIIGEGGKIDVLRADPVLVGRFATNADLAGEAVVHLLAELADRRNAGDDIGAMEAVRLALAEAIGFPAVDENFTRFGSDRIDPAFASEAVLRAIPDLGTSQMAQIIAAPPAERSQYTSLSGYFASGSRRFTLVARLSEKPGQRFEQRLPIELTSSGGIIELDRPH
jgi:hypothetical protein